MLPNLTIALEPQFFREQITAALTLGQEGIAIVPPDDARLRAIREKSRSADILLSSFKDENGNGVNPAALIVRDDVSNVIRGDVVPLVAFRNAVALCFVLFARARKAADTGPITVSWTDYFDFHPIVVGKGGTGLHRSTPAWSSFFIPQRNLLTMPSAELANNIPLGQPDPYLVRALVQLWTRRFLKPKRDDLFSRQVFRALEAAYYACSIWNKHQASLSEYGLQVSLWVTGLEVLARTAVGEVTQKRVLDLLREYEWNDQNLRARRYTRTFEERRAGKVTVRRVRATAIEKLCSALYQARHKYVHGDNVNLPLLVPPVGSMNPPLPQAAGLVFRVALGSFLERRIERRDFFEPGGLGYVEHEAFSTYEAALRNLIGAQGKRSRS